jgi:hypothetical protein
VVTARIARAFATPDRDPDAFRRIAAQAVAQVMLDAGRNSVGQLDLRRYPAEDAESVLAAVYAPDDADRLWIERYCAEYPAGWIALVTIEVAHAS